MNCLFSVRKLFNVVYVDKIHPKYYFVYQHVANLLFDKKNNKRKARLTKREFTQTPYISSYGLFS